jgi:hypothetical protein
MCACVCARVRVSGGPDAQVLQELALAERLGERLHLRGVDGPATHRVRVRPAAAAHQWAVVGTNRLV